MTKPVGMNKQWQKNKIKWRFDDLSNPPKKKNMQHQKKSIANQVPLNSSKRKLESDGSISLI